DSHADDLILFCGWLRGSEKNQVLRNASLLALPSRQENFGLCVLEALSHGVPVIVSPGVNVAADVVSAGAGWLSTVDTNALENTLAQALASEEERLRRGMVGKKFSEDFQWPRIAEQLEKMYASVIDNGRPKACV
ncbi:MAG TPA: glycosyltransferase, partial [Pyrinomonadaceae bacterium]|nr:glycosyltransferase [Pyrinomonadaceae bacterium]